MTGQTKHLESEGENLYDDKNKLIPISSSVFEHPNTKARYIFEIYEGSAVGFSLDSWQYTNKRYERTNIWKPSINELEEFAGTYSSDDSNTTYTVKIKNDRLVLEQQPGRVQVLTPVYEDAFLGTFREPGFDKNWNSERFSSDGIFRFRRDATGFVGELSGSWGRVFDMRFQRQEN